MTDNLSCVSNSNDEMINTATLLLNNHYDLSNLSKRQILLSVDKIVEKRNKRLEYMERQLEKCREPTVENLNGFHELNWRTWELERYSRKSCLVFSNIERQPSSTSTVLSIINNILKVGTTEHDIAACHRLQNGRVVPVIAKTLYHKHRDLLWRRKSRLRGILKSERKPVIFEELMIPIDWEIRQ